MVIHESWVQRVDGNLYMEVHVGVDPQLTLGQAHFLVDRLENEIRQQAPHLSKVHTHIEMANREVLEGDPVSADLEQRVRQAVNQIVDSIPSLNYPHNIIVRRNRGLNQGYSVSLECTVDADTPVTDAHQLSTLLERELSAHLDNLVEVFVHLEPPEN